MPPMEIHMSEKYGKKLIELVERDIQKRMANDIRFTIRKEAELLGVNEQTLNSWLRQKSVGKMSFENLRAVLNALGPEAYAALDLNLPEPEKE